MMNKELTFEISETDEGVRLDKFLATKMPEYSRNEIQKFPITLNCDVAPKNSVKLRVGDTVAVEIPEKEVHETLQPAQDSDIDIMFEDDDIIVVNKPRGVSMYPGAGHETDTLVQRVLAHTSLSSIGDSGRPGVVHRLDKDTSGAVILAKTDRAHHVLTVTFSNHDLTRKYIAFVWGIPTWEEADITGNIGRSTKNRQKMTMLKYGGKEAHTQARVMNAWARENVTQLKCTLLTGRTHQIRVHLSSHGFPLLCDPVYGRGSSRLGSVKNPALLDFIREHDGQMLHAEVLDLKHPVTGEALHFKARLPEDMQELKEILNDD